MSIKIPSIKGLLHSIAVAKARAARYGVEAAARHKCPREAHEAGESAERCALEAVKLEKMLAEDVDMIFQIHTICEFIELQKVKTPHRQLALRALENAEMHLRREIGDEPGKI